MADRRLQLSIVILRVAFVKGPRVCMSTAFSVGAGIIEANISLLKGTGMSKDPTIELFPFASSAAAGLLGIPLKPSVILIRWPVVIIVCYLLLDPAEQYLPAAFFQIFIILYIFSNVLLYLFKEARFTSRRFFYPLIITDTLALTLSLIINGRTEISFYLTFFFLVIVSCIFEDARLRAVITFLAPLAYGVLLFHWRNAVDSSHFLLLPYLFVITLYYGYFTQLVRAEKRLREESEQRGRGKREALDILSHEFRTPLNLIGGYAEALLASTFGNLNLEQQQACVKIRRQSDNLLSIINSIMHLARVEAGESAIERRAIMLGEFLDDIRSGYQAPLDKPVSLNWSWPKDLPTLQSDQAKLMIILQNLIDNAIKFTDEGQITISARRATKDNAVEIDVADTGIGIPEDAQLLIFERFHQVDSSSTRIHGGVGLGLYIVKVLTELLGGSITVKSEPGQGSTFTLSMPV